MKKLLLLVCATAMLHIARADEGMWIPMLIGKNYDEMLRKGLRLSKEDLYSINHSSVKDAIVQFNGGCTAEIISGNGLLLTNHHCGYDPIATLSSVEHNYLDNGFWAHSMKEELPAKGVSVIFLERMEDITDDVMKAVGNSTGEEYNKKYNDFKKELEEKASKKGKYVANVKDYFNGNQFFLIIYKKYTDIRLVGTPPKSLGKFGGDTDNWMWPRHTADFSMFRVYAGKDNQPAAYSEENVPLKPKKFLPVSIKGVQEGDYAMIFGYPGRTNRYEVSQGVSLAVNEVNPTIVSIRDKRLAIMHSHMMADKKVYLQLTAGYQRIANYWKYFIGQTEQLKRLNIVEAKKGQEAAFMTWANNNKYDASFMKEYDALFSDYMPYAKHTVYYTECFKAPATARIGALLEPLYKYLSKKERNEDSIKKYTTTIQTEYRKLLKDYEKATDKELLAEMSQMYYNNVPKNQLPDVYKNIIFKKFGSDKSTATYKNYAAYVMSHTFMLDSNKLNNFLKKPTKKAIDSDAVAQYSLSFVHNFTEHYQPKVDAYNNKKKELGRSYIKGLMAMKADKTFYPDANSTMRITYGKVLSYEPKDGMHYNYYTTLDGLMDKYKPKDEEFDVPADLIQLYNKKDYGRYADEDGTLHTCFITNNDITGGNSGSPCINAYGELIGAAFDGNWEAMSGDISFDKKYKRTIVCDIRYILFLIDKMGHANNIINEMDIRN